MVAVTSERDLMTDSNKLSLWNTTAQEQDFSVPFSDNGAEVDVAVVGGGFTGLSTALHASEAGMSTHVLEARQIGFGGSGRNVGLVNAGVWHPPAKVRAQLGDIYGPRFLKVFGNGPQTVFNLIEKHQIRCEATRTGTIHAAHAAAGLEDLKARHAEWQRMGEPVELLDRDAVRQLIGSSEFHGGLVDRRAGTINPMAYCRGLARAASGAGARISTGVTVTGLTRHGDRWRVKTDRGMLLAKKVVLGTNAYTDDLWPRLQRSFTRIHYFQLATRPLGPEASHILPERQGLWDTGKIMFSLRRDSFDRLIIGSMGKVVGGHDGGLSHRWARKQIARIFPFLREVEFEDAWHGAIAMTPDHLPRICQLDEGVYTGIGYNGRGITTGTIFGQAIAGLLQGGSPDDLPLPITYVQKVASAPVMSRLYQAAFTVNQFIKSF